MEIALKIFEVIVMLLGCCAFMTLVYISILALVDKIEQVMKRQNKIRCLCKHEYEQMSAWYIPNEDYKECKFRCRKCGKVIKLNVVVMKWGVSNEID